MQSRRAQHPRATACHRSNRTRSAGACGFPDPGLEQRQLDTVQRSHVHQRPVFHIGDLGSPVPRAALCPGSACNGVWSFATSLTVVRLSVRVVQGSGYACSGALSCSKVVELIGRNALGASPPARHRPRTNVPSARHGHATPSGQRLRYQTACRASIALNPGSLFPEPWFL